MPRFGLQTLVSRQAECVATLDREAMLFESIFKVELAGRLHLALLSVQGDAGAHVKTSPFEIDQLHMAFWAECIDDAMPPVVFTHVVDFVPAAVADAMADRLLKLSQTAA